MIDRAQHFLRQAEAFREQRNEWTHVAAFYAAYHALCHALSQDPVFHDIDTPPKVHRNLSLGSRGVRHHSGNPRSDRGPGLNQIVGYLYGDESPCPIHREYLDLHAASVTVRYEDGKTSATLADSVANAKHVVENVAAGRVKALIPRKNS